MPDIARTFLLVSLLTLACDTTEPAAAGDKPAATDDASAALGKKLVGVWIEQGDSQEIYELTGERFKSVHPKIEGAKPMEGPYSIVKVEGNVVTIKPSIDLGEGKSFAGDEQVITIVDDDTIDRRNAKNNSGGVFKRKKA
jgi:hypothetical protein